MTQVLVVAADGSEDIETVTPVDVLRRAGITVTLASVHDRPGITCARGTRITCDALLGDVAGRDFDMVVLPGGMPGATHLHDSATLAALLRRQQAAGRWLAAICASPAVVLAAHGLLAGHKATCYPAFRDRLPAGSATDAPVVVDGRVITSQGPATALAFSLALVEALQGAGRARDVGGPMLA